MPERRVMLCPRCGAPLPPSAANEPVKCTFCEVTSVPSVEASDAAPSATAPAATPTELLCPRCELKLFSGNAHGVELLACGGCGGVWLDNASGKRAVASGDAMVTDMAALAARRATATPDTARGARCPSCRGTMDRVRVVRAGVDIDVCNTHGTWFDRSELGLVLQAMRAPARPAPPPPDVPLDPREIPNFHQASAPDLAEVGLVAGGALAILAGLASLVDTK